MTDPLTPIPVPTSIGPVSVPPTVLTTQEAPMSATTLTPASSQIPGIAKYAFTASAESKVRAEMTRIEGLAKRALSHLTGTYAISLTALLVSVFVLFKSCR